MDEGRNVILLFPELIDFGHGLSNGQEGKVAEQKSFVCSKVRDLFVDLRKLYGYTGKKMLMSLGLKLSYILLPESGGHRRWEPEMVGNE
jgi:hypothetical protein